MQPIQDKDFDQLFKDAFADAEITPSKNLWNSIEKEMEPKKTRKLPVYWLAAAAILLIASVGIVLYNQQTEQPKQYAIHKTEAVKPEQSLTPVVQDTGIVIEDKIAQPFVVQEEQKTEVAQVKTPVTEVKDKVTPAAQVFKQEVVVAKVEEPKKDIKQKIEEAILTKEETILASTPALVKTDEVLNENDAAENKGIRNVGDLVNLVVNKMDKRKDKFIQFRTDDDDSSVSSINIGPFKIGKRNRK